MNSSLPGYWDFRSCAWVGAEPVYLMPPRRTPEMQLPRPAAPHEDVALAEDTDLVEVR